MRDVARLLFTTLAVSAMAGCHLVLDPARHEEREADAGPTRDTGPPRDAGRPCTTNAECGPAGIARCGAAMRCERCAPTTEVISIPLVDGASYRGFAETLRVAIRDEDAYTVVHLALVVEVAGAGAAYTAAYGVGEDELFEIEPLGTPDDGDWRNAAPSAVAFGASDGAPRLELGALTGMGEDVLYVGSPTSGGGVQLPRADLSGRYADPPFASLGVDRTGWVWIGGDSTGPAMTLDGVIDLDATGAALLVGPDVGEVDRLIGGPGRWVAARQVGEPFEEAYLAMWSPYDLPDPVPFIDPEGWPTDVAWLGGDRYVVLARAGEGQVRLVELTCDAASCRIDAARTTEASAFFGEPQLFPLSRGALVVGHPSGIQMDVDPSFEVRWLDAELEPFDAALGPGLSEGGAAILPFGDRATTAPGLGSYGAHADVLELADRLVIAVAMLTAPDVLDRQEIRLAVAEGCAP